MPELTVVISGTTTEVGKTWVTVRLAKLLRHAGASVVARKPVQSFDPGDDPTDSEVLGAATGEPSAVVCPPERSFGRALAPPIAAEALGLPPIHLTSVVAGLSLPDRGIALVEGVGGPRSPLTHDGDTVALAAVLEADLVVIVGEPSLGAINAIRLSHDAFGGRPSIVFLNRYDPADEVHRTNRAWLTDVAKLEVSTGTDELAARLLDHPNLEGR